MDTVTRITETTQAPAPAHVDNAHTREAHTRENAHTREAHTRENAHTREALEAWESATDAALGSKDWNPSVRLVVRAIAVAHKREEASSGITAANGEQPITRGTISKISGLSLDTVRSAIEDLENAGIIVTRMEKRQFRRKLPDGTYKTEWENIGYFRFPAGNAIQMLHTFARSSPVGGRSQGGLHEREATRDENGLFKTRCPHCHELGTLKKRVSVVCVVCGTVMDPQTAHPPKPLDVVVPKLSTTKCTKRQVAVSRNGASPASPASPPPASENPPKTTGETSEPPPSKNGNKPATPQAAVSRETTREDIAVLDVDALHIARGGTVQTYPVSEKPHLAHVLDHAAHAGIEQLWVTPAWAHARGLPASIQLNVHEHTFTTGAIDAGWSLTPGGLARWISARKPRERGYSAVRIAFPGYDGHTDLKTASDGRTLLDALAYFEQATGQRYLGHPLRTSARLIKTSNPGRPLESVELPPCAEDRLVEWAYSWMRAPSLEETNGRHVQAYDRNAAYLAVCSSLTVGAGKLYHLTGPFHAIDRTRAGYYHARIDWTAHNHADRLPDPFHDARHAPGEHHWYTGQTMALAVELGAKIDVDEAYLWGQTQRPLERWYTRLRDARYALEQSTERYPNREAAALARGLVKACYTRMVGRFTAHLDTLDDDALYRPDIRHAIIGAARANMTRTLLACADHNRTPILVDTDALFFLSDSPDASPPEPLELSAQLGKFKRSGCWPASDFCEPMRVDGATVGRVLKAANGPR